MKLMLLARVRRRAPSLGGKIITNDKGKVITVTYER